MPKPEDAGALTQIKKRIGIPLICDIHFDYKMALAALDHPIDKIRINPGNIGGDTHDRFRQVVRKAKERGLPMRIGVNAGSLERELCEKYEFPCPPAMVESALRYIEIAESRGLSRHRRVAEVDATCWSRWRRIGCTPSCATTRRTSASPKPGKPPYAVTKSAAGLAPILLDGIGDTIRISLLGDPVPEIAAAFDILQATQRRVRRPELIACPTCGRLAIDLEKIIAELETRLSGKRLPVKISVLGCVVNGPGEAREADIGIAAGNGQGMIFRNGEMVRRVPEAEIVDALMEEAGPLGDRESAPAPEVVGCRRVSAGGCCRSSRASDMVWPSPWNDRSRVRRRY